jgi:deoxyribose-phosphate aldolase
LFFGAPNVESQDLEKLIQTITEEMLAYLGAQPGSFRGVELSEIYCPECKDRCGHLCVHKTQKAIEAGAARISAGGEVNSVDAQVAHLIDHTLLKPDATRDQIHKLCEEAVKFGFASVCINPWNVAQAAQSVRGSSVKVCTVVGFPLGATLPQVKIFESDAVIKLGAQEIDMVINVGALKSGLDDIVEADIRGVVETCHRGGAICKVILETALLTIEEKIRGSLAAKNACADFVKTSTGFSTGGATAEDVSLMRAVVGSDVGIKAAGGVRSFEDFKKLVAAGATRVGASASVKILEQARGLAAD